MQRVITYTGQQAQELQRAVAQRLQVLQVRIHIQAEPMARHITIL